MILQEGRYYRSRDGVTLGPISRSTRDSVYPFFFDGKTWNQVGVYSLGQESPFDLIAEVKAPPSPDATPKVDRVSLAASILPRLAAIGFAPSMAARQAIQYADAFLKEIKND